MMLVGVYLLVLLLAAVVVSIVAPRTKGIVAIYGIVAMAAISAVPAVDALIGNTHTYNFAGSYVTGPIGMEIDPLSAWFMLVISFTMITSVIYGQQYMNAYADSRNELSLHWICYLLVHAGLMSVCAMRNSIGFLISWEIMALGAFFLVIFEREKVRTIRAGINYLIQSHLAILLLTVAFIWVAIVSGTYSFDGIMQFVSQQSRLASLGLMLLFFVGFAFKAGFVPFHTWLPHAHPAAPSHVSGMMSGVLIKIGIYGIMRMLLIINVNYMVMGFFILIISVVTGIYGVMLAIIQHNLKRLLAYHSVENIGIIGIGIGVGCIALGCNNNSLAIIGFAGALLHVLNHSLFKSLLFYGAGNVYQATHCMDIEHFGGLIRKMPQTAMLFLLASLAICGLPPFNGFVSEFLIYNGLFDGINSIQGSGRTVALALSMAGLALIGGLAIMCFTKAFGTIFLGQPRAKLHSEPKEFGFVRLFPMYMAGGMIVAIGIAPKFFIGALNGALQQFVGNNATGESFQAVTTLSAIGIYMLVFIGIAAVVYGLRRWFTSHLPESKGETWGCGYLAPTPKIQYTASSFVRSYRRLAKSVLQVKKRKIDVEGIFPGKAEYATEALDRTETGLIIKPLRMIRRLLSHFSIMQNGRLQFYIFYGMFFIILIAGVPFMFKLIRLFINYLNTL
ncbi:MAG: hypothetical protein MJ069_00790 [Salinivirgaceae bacterium]|nr:hypothetical protein [Salinivirgaceae bacterium]